MGTSTALAAAGLLPTIVVCVFLLIIVSMVLVLVRKVGPSSDGDVQAHVRLGHFFSLTVRVDHGDSRAHGECLAREGMNASAIGAEGLTAQVPHVSQSEVGTKVPATRQDAGT
ncbi:hypothetical protein [Nocardioides mangrovi]|uniref:hypothetical protein n=1 Tax=Nocardioides mangrovi TaxID=2874580 RepID=UPI001CC7484D|nr:hypothetical protein [Nocardioides mangrovi]